MYIMSSFFSTKSILSTGFGYSFIFEGEFSSSPILVIFILFMRDNPSGIKRSRFALEGSKFTLIL